MGKERIHLNEKSVYPQKLLYGLVHNNNIISCSHFFRSSYNASNQLGEALCDGSNNGCEGDQFTIGHLIFMKITPSSTLSYFRIQKRPLLYNVCMSYLNFKQTKRGQIYHSHPVSTRFVLHLCTGKPAGFAKAVFMGVVQLIINMNVTQSLHLHVQTFSRLCINQAMQTRRGRFLFV